MVSHNRSLFFASIRNLQNYTISRLLEAYYSSTSMGKVITKTSWVILFLYLLFLTANKELKQSSRALIREKPTLCMLKRSIKNHENLFFITTAALLHKNWYCQGTLKQTLDCWILITSKPNPNLTAYYSLLVNCAIRQYE